MYQIGDFVVYGVQGVCRVLGQEKQLVNRKRVEYLVLEPLSRGESKFYLPLQNQTAMEKLQPLLSKEELELLLKSEQIRGNCWIQVESLRKQHYRELLAGGDRAGLLRMLYNLYRYRAQLEESGKKFHQCDDNFLRDAEKLLAGEIAVVMHMELPQAIAYLREKLNG